MSHVDVQEVLGALIRVPSSAIPSEVRHAAVRTAVNSWSLSVGSSEHEAVRIAHRAVLPRGGGGATLLGSGDSAGPLVASFVNGIGAHVEDFDDTHLGTVVHPGCVVVPAATAAAEVVGASGPQLVEAIAIGTELALRVAIGLGFGHFDRGWHLTSSVGRLGASAAASRLLGLSDEAAAVALGIAATETAGLQEALGTMTKSYHAGKASTDGLQASFLARAGVTGRWEWAATLASCSAPAGDLAPMVEGILEEWEIVRNAIKPYACGIVSHPVIDAGIAFRERVPQASLLGVTVEVNPVVLDVMGVSDPQDGLQTKFSVYHCFAVGFLEGRGGLGEFSDAMARRPDVVDLRRKVRVVLDAALAKDECVARARLVDGSEMTVHVEHAVGSAARQMTDDELTDKCVRVAAPVLGADGARHFVASGFAIDEQPEVRGTLRLAGPPER